MPCSWCSGILGRQRDAANLIALTSQIPAQSIHSRAALRRCICALCSSIFSSVAVMTRAYPEYLKDREELFLLQSISSYILLACGVVYFISGMFCIGMVKRARQKKEVSREQAIKDLGVISLRSIYIKLLFGYRTCWISRENCFIISCWLALDRYCNDVHVAATLEKESSYQQYLTPSPLLSFVCTMLFVRINNVAQTNDCRSLSSVEKNLRHCWSLAKLDSELERG
ncbi:hypothetical protein SASPL_132152 [Salvia splendens]|uniref:Uncharacterized protein n=1 Tax=Salvia splendens TaxID=180675 RepID=A0A8X8X905_SALSN|nr:hypothetical protein SASPL_132152 [Salvia splendens]